MSENKKNPNPGEPISEEQLDAVAGGNTASNPTQSFNCWFKADGGPREDGRTQCRTECKGKFDDSGPVYPSEEGEWHTCYCWGTDNCIDRWHKHCGNPKRFN